MNHHSDPFDTSGPEFEGLSPDEKFNLKRQLRIRDRNHRLYIKELRRPPVRLGPVVGIAIGVIFLLGTLLIR